jgi:hypothetical protein
MANRAQDISSAYLHDVSAVSGTQNRLFNQCKVRLNIHLEVPTAATPTVYHKDVKINHVVAGLCKFFHDIRRHEDVSLDDMALADRILGVVTQGISQLTITKITLTSDNETDLDAVTVIDLSMSDEEEEVPVPGEGGNMAMTPEQAPVPYPSVPSAGRLDDGVQV